MTLPWNKMSQLCFVCLSRAIFSTICKNRLIVKYVTYAFILLNIDTRKIYSDEITSFTFVW